MKNLLLEKKSQWKIIDEKGKTIAKGFTNKCCAQQMLPKYKLNKQENLQIVEEDENE